MSYQKRANKAKNKKKGGIDFSGDPEEEAVQFVSSREVFVTPYGPAAIIRKVADPKDELRKLKEQVNAAERVLETSAKIALAPRYSSRLRYKALANTTNSLRSVASSIRSQINEVDDSMAVDEAQLYQINYDVQALSNAAVSQVQKEVRGRYMGEYRRRLRRNDKDEEDAIVSISDPVARYNALIASALNNAEQQPIYANDDSDSVQLIAEDEFLQVKAPRKFDREQFRAKRERLQEQLNITNYRFDRIEEQIRYQQEEQKRSLSVVPDDKFLRQQKKKPEEAEEITMIDTSITRYQALPSYKDDPLYSRYDKFSRTAQTAMIRAKALDDRYVAPRARTFYYREFQPGSLSDYQSTPMMFSLVPPTDIKNPETFFFEGSSRTSTILKYTKAAQDVLVGKSWKFTYTPLISLMEVFRREMYQSSSWYANVRDAIGGDEPTPYLDLNMLARQITDDGRASKGADSLVYRATYRYYTMLDVINSDLIDPFRDMKAAIAIEMVDTIGRAIFKGYDSQFAFEIAMRHSSSNPVKSNRDKDTPQTLFDDFTTTNPLASRKGRFMMWSMSGYLLEMLETLQDSPFVQDYQVQYNMTLNPTAAVYINEDDFYNGTMIQEKVRRAAGATTITTKGPIYLMRVLYDILTPQSNEVAYNELVDHIKWMNNKESRKAVKRAPLPGQLPPPVSINDAQQFSTFINNTLDMNKQAPATFERMRSPEYYLRKKDDKMGDFQEDNDGGGGGSPPPTEMIRASNAPPAYYYQYQYQYQPPSAPPGDGGGGGGDPPNDDEGRYDPIDDGHREQTQTEDEEEMDAPAESEKEEEEEEKMQVEPKIAIVQEVQPEEAKQAVDEVRAVAIENELQGAQELIHRSAYAQRELYEEIFKHRLNMYHAATKEDIAKLNLNLSQRGAEMEEAKNLISTQTYQIDRASKARIDALLYQTQNNLQRTLLKRPTIHRDMIRDRDSAFSELTEIAEEFRMAQFNDANSYYSVDDIDTRRYKMFGDTSKKDEWTRTKDLYGTTRGFFTPPIQPNVRDSSDRADQAKVKAKIALANRPRASAAHAMGVSGGGGDEPSSSSSSSLTRRQLSEIREGTIAEEDEESKGSNYESVPTQYNRRINPTFIAPRSLARRRRRDSDVAADVGVGTDTALMAEYITGMQGINELLGESEALKNLRNYFLSAQERVRMKKKAIKDDIMYQNYLKKKLDEFYTIEYYLMYEKANMTDVNILENPKTQELINVIASLGHRVPTASKIWNFFNDDRKTAEDRRKYVTDSTFLNDLTQVGRELRDQQKETEKLSNRIDIFYKARYEIDWKGRMIDDKTIATRIRQSRIIDALDLIKYKVDDAGKLKKMLKDGIDAPFYLRYLISEGTAEALLYDIEFYLEGKLREQKYALNETNKVIRNTNYLRNSIQLLEPSKVVAVVDKSNIKTQLREIGKVVPEALEIHNELTTRYGDDLQNYIKNDLAGDLAALKFYVKAKKYDNIELASNVHTNFNELRIQERELQALKDRGEKFRQRMDDYFTQLGLAQYVSNGNVLSYDVLDKYEDGLIAVKASQKEMTKVQSYVESLDKETTSIRRQVYSNQMRLNDSVMTVLQKIKDLNFLTPTQSQAVDTYINYIRQGNVTSSQIATISQGVRNIVTIADSEKIRLQSEKDLVESLFAQMRGLSDDYRNLQRKLESNENEFEYLQGQLRKYNVNLPFVYNGLFLTKYSIRYARDDSQAYLDTVERENRAITEDISRVKRIGGVIEYQIREGKTLRDKIDDQFETIQQQFNNAYYENKANNIAGINTIPLVDKELRKLQVSNKDREAIIEELKEKTFKVKEQIMEGKRMEDYLKQQQKALEKYLGTERLQVVYIASLYSAVENMKRYLDQQEYIQKDLSRGKYESFEKEFKLSLNSVYQIAKDFNNIDNQMVLNLGYYTADQRSLLENMQRNAPEQLLSGYFKQVVQNLAQSRIVEDENAPDRSPFKIQQDQLMKMMEKQLSTYIARLHVLVSATSNNNYLGNGADKFRDEIMQPGQKELAALKNSIDQFSEIFAKYYLLDIRYKNMLLNGTNQVKGELKYLVSIENPDGVYKDILLIKGNITDINNRMDTQLGMAPSFISDKAKDVVKALYRIDDKLYAVQGEARYLKYRKTIEDIIAPQVRALVNNINRRNGMNFVPDYSVMNYVAQAYTSLFEESVYKFMSLTGGDEEQMRQTSAEYIVRTLKKNNLLNERDQEEAKYAMVRFATLFDERTKKELFDRVGRAMSEYHRQIFSEIDTKHIADFLESKSYATRYIDQNLRPPESIERQRPQMIREAIDAFKGAKQLIPYVRGDIRVSVLLNQVRPAELHKDEPEELKEKVKAAIMKRTGQKEGLFMFGRFGYVDGQYKGLSLADLTSITSVQRYIQLLPKEKLGKKMQEVASERVDLAYSVEEYQIDVNSPEDQRVLKDETLNLLAFFQHYGMDMIDGRPSKHTSYRMYKVKSIEDLHNLPPKSMLEFAMDYVYNAPQLLASVISTIQHAADEGVRPTKRQIMQLFAMKNIDRNMRSIIRSHYEILPTFYVDFDADYNAYLREILKGATVENRNMTGAYIDNELLDYEEVGYKVEDFISAKVDYFTKYAFEFIDNDMKFLDKVDYIIADRKDERTDLDKYEKVNKYVEGYSKNFQDHLMGLLMKQGLKSFFDSDGQSKKYAQQKAQNMAPRFVYPPPMYPQRVSQIDAYGYAQNTQAGIPISRMLGGGNPAYPYMAFKGSEAEASGDSGKSRLTSAAVQAGEKVDKLTKQDLLFIEKIYYDDQLRKLQYRDEQSGTSRDLTIDEKRTYIRILVLILLALYMDQIRKLSREEKEAQERKLYDKYVAKENPTALMYMVNKLASRMKKEYGGGGEAN